MTIAVVMLRVPINGTTTVSTSSHLVRVKLCRKATRVSYRPELSLARLSRLA
jgi:hypothetical protein